MSHLRLVPPLPAAETPVVPASRPELGERLATRAPNTAWDDPKVVALSFFQAASGVCLCRACSMKRHPSYGG